jgi:hypothetical protein
MTSWQASGLLGLVGDERIAFLSEPHPAELALAHHFGFAAVEPKMLSTVRGSPSRQGGFYSEILIYNVNNKRKFAKTVYPNREHEEVASLDARTCR